MSDGPVAPRGLTTYRMTEAIVPESFSFRQFSPSVDVYLKSEVDARLAEATATENTTGEELTAKQWKAKFNKLCCDVDDALNGVQLPDDSNYSAKRIVARLAEGAQARQLSVDDALDVYVPGAWLCPKCKFALQKVTLFVQSGEAGSSRDDVMNMTGEICPNDGEPMIRETWHDRAESNRKWGEDLMNQIIALTSTTNLPDALDHLKDLPSLRADLSALREAQKPPTQDELNAVLNVCMSYIMGGGKDFNDAMNALRSLSRQPSEDQA